MILESIFDYQKNVLNILINLIFLLFFCDDRCRIIQSQKYMIRSNFLKYQGRKSNKNKNE
jgi:hypothetical protein